MDTKVMGTKVMGYARGGVVPKSSNTSGKKDGKCSVQEDLPHRSAMSSITPGDPYNRMTGNYGKSARSPFADMVGE